MKGSEIQFIIAISSRPIIVEKRTDGRGRREEAKRKKKMVDSDAKLRMQRRE